MSEQRSLATARALISTTDDADLKDALREQCGHFDETLRELQASMQEIRL